MFNLVFLLVAAALVSYQSDFQASASRTLSKNREDNNLQPNVVPSRKRVVWNFVRIHKPPPEIIRVLPSQRTVLVCQVTGAPLPQVSWLKNGDQIMDFEEESNEIITTDPRSFGMAISKVVIDNPINGDVYTCLASNGVKRNSSSTTILVDGESDPASLLENLLIPPKPVITYFLKSAIVTQGSNILLPCRVAGNAEIVWKDNYGNDIDENSIQQILPSGDLLISNLGWRDMGEYICVAQNEFGNDSATTFVYPAANKRST